MTANAAPPGFHARCVSHARIHPSRQAVVAAGTELDYAALLRRVDHGAAFLAARGIGPGATVGLTIRDEVEHLVASLALFALGTRQITLASHDQPKMRRDLADRAGVTHRLVDDPADDGGDDAVLAWRRGDASAETIPAIPPTSAEGRLFLRTSGTTGRTNILEFSESQIGLQAERHADYAGERLLRLAAIEHNNSKRHRLYALWNGGTNIFFDSRGSDPIGFIRDQRVSCLDISRMHAEGLPHLKGADQLAALKIRTGGSAVPWPTRAAIERAVSRNLYVRYAASETGAIAMALPGEHDADECSGRPVAGVEIRIVDSTGADLPPGEVGRIGVRAPGMVERYHDNAEQTAARFRDGWFYPGDVGYRRADGQIVVQGRADEMIVMNGLNIFPKEIEAVLESHPQVRYAAALAIESRIHGNIPVAAVELYENASITGAELARWAHPLLGLRTPKRIVLVPALPRNSQGKVTKRDLIPLFAVKRPG